jgi:hypothetical protein
MYQGILHAHSGLRWIILAGLIIVIFNGFSGKSSGREFTEKDRKLGLIAFIGSHVQLLLGFYLYFVNGNGKVNLAAPMANAFSRFFTVEHISGMLIAIILITVGYIKSKKASESKQKFSTVATYYLIALLIILVTIPWPFREHLAANWF